LDSTTTSCVLVCPNGYYNNLSDHKCAACNSACATCSGSGTSACLSCSATYFLQASTSQCVSSCDPGQYPSSGTPSSCLSCNQSCLKCTGPSSTECTACTGSLYYSSSTHACVADCPAGYVKSSSIANLCSPCHTDCATCSGTSSSECLTCSSTLFFESSTQSCVSVCDSGQYGSSSPPRSCVSCNASCQTCSGASASSCVSCSGSLFLNESSSMCVSDCPSGTFKEASTNKCAACSNRCATCSGSSNSQCLSCSSPLFF